MAEGLTPRLHLASDPVRLHQPATAFARGGDRWVGSLLTDDAVLAMPEIGMAAPPAELHDGQHLTEPTDEAMA